MATAETAAFVTHRKEKKSWNSKNLNSSKYKIRGADHAKQKYSSNKWKQLGEWPGESPQKQQHARDRSGKYAAKKNADAF
jgi:hypothetical protein